MAVSLAAIDLDATRGIAVLGLLERANVPPQPAFYALLYDYVAGVRGLLSSRIDEILHDPHPAPGATGERLYAEFVAPYRSPDAIERAIANATERLRTLDLLLVERAEAARTHTESLDQANFDFTRQTLDIGLMREWVERLDAANARLRLVNDTLTEQLHAASSELQATQASIDRSRAGMRRDPLTGLANRAGIDLEIAHLLARRNGEALACAVVDIDHFKSLNDSYGHQLGDEVLRIVSRALLVSTRRTDIVGRPGGDEFLVILPETDMAAARDAGERMRQAILDSDLSAVLGAGVLGGITASVGVAPYHPGDTIASLVARADCSLYEAKRRGRNRVVCEGDPDKKSTA